MTELPSPRTVVGVFAHPDDEVFCAGGSFATWAAAGATVIVVSATRGEAGQIRDAAVATRRTLAAVRESELRRSCAHLGVARVEILDHVDGSLPDVDTAELTAAIHRLLADAHPDLVVTFGEDGAYGHPDHIVIGDATAAALAQLWAAGRSRAALLRSHFPRLDVSLAQRLARWLVSMEDRFAGGAEFGRALTVFAQESATMRFASDDVRVVWYPPGSLIVEQGEPSSGLFLILSGTVEVVQDDGTASRSLRTLRDGQFFGELGVEHGHARSASVIASGNVTCLLLSAHPSTKYAGRGAVAHAELAVEQPAVPDAVPANLVRIDVRAAVESKVRALAEHRSQYPIDPAMFPRAMLEDMYGVEQFVVTQPPPR